MTENALLSWSGGKDSALALYEIQHHYDYSVAALLTTVTEDYNRISMHGVRNRLLEMQAESLRLPLEKVTITKSATNDEYEVKMKKMLLRYQRHGVSSVVIGDIFLEDLRNYREQHLSTIGMKAVFPLWKKDTTQLAQQFITLGFKAVVTCVDSQVLDKKFAGRYYDEDLLSELPPFADPCGENGEFHTFVFDGPIFREKIPFKSGETVLRDNRFYFFDLIPNDHT